MTFVITPLRLTHMKEGQNKTVGKARRPIDTDLFTNRFLRDASCYNSCLGLIQSACRLKNLLITFSNSAFTSILIQVCKIINIQMKDSISISSKYRS